MNQQFEILLIEDDDNDAELAVMALKNGSITNSLLRLQDGEEALNYIFATGKYLERNVAELPKLILLDIKVPKVGGIEVLRRIKSDERMKLIPVVILTSSREDKDIVEGYKHGNNSYIVKQVDFEKYTSEISTIGYYWLKINQPPK